MKEILYEQNDSLDEQIALVKHWSLNEFVERINKGPLKTKALYEFVYVKDPKKFAVYNEKYDFPWEVERKLIGSGRKDLMKIYFKNRSCDSRNEELLICYPVALSTYLNYRGLSKEGQVYLFRERSIKDKRRYLNKYYPCREGEEELLLSRDEKMVDFYSKKHPVRESTKEKLQKSKRVKSLKTIEKNQKKVVTVVAEAS